MMVITDLDGTLLPSTGIFNPTDVATFEALGRRQIVRVIATGRSLYSARQVLPLTFPLDYLIFSSGAGILEWVSQQILVAHHLSHEELFEAFTAVHTHGLDFMIHAPIPENHYFWYVATGRDNPDFYRRCQRYQQFATPFEAMLLPQIQQASQIVAVDPAPGAASHYERIRQELRKLHVIRSTSPMDGCSTWIEIFPSSVSKALASEWVAYRRKISRAATLALGNDYNDLDLLQWAGTSYVVNNAPADLQQLYPVVSSHNEAGFSQAVTQWKRSLRYESSTSRDEQEPS